MRARLLGDGFATSTCPLGDPLNPGERQKIVELITSSEMIKDIPEENPISLIFFTFENGKRIWQDGFLMEKTNY